MEEKRFLLVVILLALTPCCSTQSKNVKSATVNGAPNLLTPEVKCIQKPEFTDETHWEQAHLVCEIKKGATWSPR